MYIRRKVFSQAQDWDYGYEMEERLYSTGDVELDEILERAFCEGYEAAQREFGLKEKAEAAGKWVKDKASAAKGKVVEYLGKEGKMAKAISEGADKFIKKVGPKGIDPKELNKLANKYIKEGYSIKKANELALKELKPNKFITKAREAGKWVGQKVKENPRAAAGIAAGTALAGIGAGVYASKHRDEE